MSNRVERTAEAVVRADRFEPRLREWAKVSEFECTGRTPTQWTFRRGDPLLRGWPNWDLDQLPARAVAEVVNEAPFTVRASLEIRFGGRMSTRAEDETDVEQQLGLMLAYLRGVYDF